MDDSRLGDFGEIAIVERIRQLLPERDDILQGAGDDCAVVSAAPGYDLLLTSDSVIEGVHFETGTDPAAVGHKAIGRVLSDLAAMAGQPRWALVNISAPATMQAQQLEALYSGALSLAGSHGLAIVGGDVAQASVLTLNVFAVGTAPAGRAVRRSGASAGDLIYVTGSLGGSRAGKHLSFTPRVHEGILLRDLASSMIDISDGLATDLHHILNASGVGAKLRAADIPVSPEAAVDDGRTPLHHAMTDGEDHELLFTMAPDRTDAIRTEWAGHTDLACTCIGAINDSKGVAECIGPDGSASRIDQDGFSHFD